VAVSFIGGENRSTQVKPSIAESLIPSHGEVNSQTCI